MPDWLTQSGQCQTMANLGILACRLPLFPDCPIGCCSPYHRLQSTDCFTDSIHWPEGCTVPFWSGPFQNWPVPERSGSYEFKKLCVPEDLFHSVPELQLQLQLQLQLYLQLQLQLQLRLQLQLQLQDAPVRSSPVRSRVRSVPCQSMPFHCP